MKLYSVITDKKSSDVSCVPYYCLAKTFHISVCSCARLSTSWYKTLLFVPVVSVNMYM